MMEVDGAEADMGTAPEVSPDQVGETSKEGLRRMRLLATNPPILTES